MSLLLTVKAMAFDRQIDGRPVGVKGKPAYLRYLFAVLTVAAAFGIRMILQPWTGTGAPFVFFFGTVLISGFFWGAGPGLLAGFLSALVSAFFFVYQAGYSGAQAIAQCILFIIETSIVCTLADSFAKAKRRSEANESAAKQAEAQIREWQIIFEKQELEARNRLERANRALFKREAELKEAQRLAHVGNWSWDAKSDTVKWSEEVYRIFGRDPKLPAPKFHSEHPGLFTAESMGMLNTAVEKALRDTTPYELDLELRRPDGSTRSVLARGEPIRDTSGHIEGLYGTIQDTTELKRLQRMREEWTSVIAHDLRQPLGTIVMCADFLSRADADKSDEKKKFIDRIRSSAFNLARMVDDLLDISQLETQRLHLERKWVDPGRVVRETTDKLSHIIQERRVVISESGELSPVFVDPGRIEQVFGNLLSNAIKYGDKEKEILVRLHSHEDEVEISVTNHGEGIPQDESSRLFDRFSRSKSTRSSKVPGLGLGLYISKGLIEAHGGRIWVESVPHHTTTFHFTLPARIDRSKEVA